MYGLRKFYNMLVDGFHPLKLILSASKIPACKLAKFLALSLIVNNSFHLSGEILEQDSSFFMGTFDMD